MGQSPPSETYNLGGKGLPFFQGKTDFGEMHPTVRMYCDSPNRIADPGDILISVRAPVGPTNVCEVKSCIGRGLAALRGKDDLEQRYLFYFLRYIEPTLAQSGQGSTFEAIGKNNLRNIEIPLPDIDEQKRIAGILAKADRLRRLRRYALEMSDGYLQAVFLEMFGDPVTNPMGWEVKELGSELKGIDSGWSPVCDDEQAGMDRWAILKLGAVTWGIYNPLQNKQLPLDIEPRPELEVKKGDLLFSRKNTIDLVGACAFVFDSPPKLMLPDTIFRFVLKDSQKLMPEYLWGLFNNTAFKKKTQTLATGSAGSMPNISKQKVKDIALPVPSPPPQEKYAKVVYKYERLRAQQREALRQADHLFEALLDQAFGDGL